MEKVLCARKRSDPAESIKEFVKTPVGGGRAGPPPPDSPAKGRSGPRVVNDVGRNTGRKPGTGGKNHDKR